MPQIAQENAQPSQIKRFPSRFRFKEENSKNQPNLKSFRIRGRALVWELCFNPVEEHEKYTI